MRLGVALPQFDFSVPGESPLQGPTVLRWAHAVEAAGLDSVWLADHVFWSIEKYGGPPGTTSAVDPLVGLAAVARATTTVRFGTLVLCTQLRPPAVAAKSLASIDVLSGGRLTVGVGAGWFEPEFRAAGIPFEPPGVRLRQLADAVEVYSAMFSGRWNDAPCKPPPVQQPHPPIVVGGKGDRLLDVVAGHADGWNIGWASTRDVYRGRLDVLHRACDKVGRDPASVHRSIGLYTLVGEDEADLRRRWERLQRHTPRGIVDKATLDEWRIGRLVGTVDQVGEQLSQWAALGVDEVIACLGALPFAVTDVDDLLLLAAARKGA